MNVRMSKNETIERTGKLLLSGWKLLAMSCPICNSPLLSKENNMRCPGCDLPVITEAKLVESNMNYTVASESKVLNNLDDKNSFMENKSDLENDNGLKPIIPNSYDELKDEFDKSNKVRDIISNKIGQKLLLGWIMLGDICLNENCHGIPLMKESGSEILLCVSCDKTYKIDNFGQIYQTNIINHMAESNVEKVLPIVTLSFDKETENDKISKLISQKLLLGWTMLDAVCSLCSGTVPLLKNKINQEYCVVCGVRSTDNKEKKNTEILTKDSSEVSNINSDVISKRSTVGSKNAMVFENDDEEEDDEDIENELNLARQSHKNILPNIQASSKSPKSTEFGRVKEILAKKLMIVSSELNNIEDTQECIHQVNLIKALIETLKLIN